MSYDQFDELLKRIPKISEAVNSFKSEIVQNAAFHALMATVNIKLPNQPSNPKQDYSPSPDKNDSDNTQDASDFFSKNDHSKPAENVKLIVAWLYSQYGVFSITRAHIQEVANSVGLTVASRSDNTIRNAKDNGKALFQQDKKGWKLTLAGEMFIKKTYQVRKGNNPLPEKDDK